MMIVGALLGILAPSLGLFAILHDFFKKPSKKVTKAESTGKYPMRRDEADITLKNIYKKIDSFPIEEKIKLHFPLKDFYDMNIVEIVEKQLSKDGYIVTKNAEFLTVTRKDKLTEGCRDAKVLAEKRKEEKSKQEAIEKTKNQTYDEAIDYINEVIEDFYTEGELRVKFPVERFKQSLLENIQKELLDKKYDVTLDESYLLISWEKKHRDADRQEFPYTYEIGQHGNESLAIRYGIANHKSYESVCVQKTKKIKNDMFEVLLVDFGNKKAKAVIEVGTDYVKTFYPMDDSWFKKYAELEETLKNTNTFTLKELATFHVNAVTAKKESSRKDNASHHKSKKKKTVKDRKSALEILGLPSDASLKQIRKAYKKLITQYHPDKVASLGPKLKKVAEEEMKLINLAYDYLK